MVIKREGSDIKFAAAAAAKSLQSCLTLCDPIDGSPPGSAIPGILQARTLEWVATSFSNAWKWKVKVRSLSRVRLFVTPWTAAYQAPPSMGFSRKEYWSGVPLPSPDIKFRRTHLGFFIWSLFEILRLHVSQTLMLTPGHCHLLTQVPAGVSIAFPPEALQGKCLFGQGT